MKKKQKEDIVVYTSICMNYLPKALVLGESLKKHNPDIKFYVVLLERSIPKEVTNDMYKIIDKIILAKDLGYEDFDKFIFKHSIVEASTSVKGQALVYLLENVANKVMYIDPDIKVYNKFDKLKDLLNKHDIILTPHLTIPEIKEQDIRNNELCALQHGVYNLGFVAVNGRDEGIKFAKWWRDRLHLYCYDDIPNGIFTDQRWVDLAPAYFDCYILKDLGHNMAPWNLSTRKLYDVSGKLLVNKKDELVFFHFSGFDSGANLSVFSNYIADKNAIEFSLRDEYVEDLNRMEQGLLGSYCWSYSLYESGEKIDTYVRILYRDRKFFNEIEESPFSMGNQYFKNLFGVNEVTKVEQTGIKNTKIYKLLRKCKYKIFK